MAVLWSTFSHDIWKISLFILILFSYLMNREMKIDFEEKAFVFLRKHVGSCKRRPNRGDFGFLKNVTCSVDGKKASGWLP